MPTVEGRPEDKERGEKEKEEPDKAEEDPNHKQKKKNGSETKGECLEIGVKEVMGEKGEGEGRRRRMSR